MVSGSSPPPQRATFQAPRRVRLPPAYPYAPHALPACGASLFRWPHREGRAQQQFCVMDRPTRAHPPPSTPRRRRTTHILAANLAALLASLLHEADDRPTRPRVHRGAAGGVRDARSKVGEPNGPSPSVCRPGARFGVRNAGSAARRGAPESLQRRDQGSSRAEFRAWPRGARPDAPGCGYVRPDLRSPAPRAPSWWVRIRYARGRESTRITSCGRLVFLQFRAGFLARWDLRRQGPTHRDRT